MTNGGGIGASIYAASKGAVQSYSRALAKDLAEFGIRVNMVSGTIDTPSTLLPTASWWRAGKTAS